MNIKILGTGCPRCRALEKVTNEALQELGLNATVEKVDDIVKILNYNVTHTPALVIDEKVIISGQVPAKEFIKEILIKNK